MGGKEGGKEGSKEGVGYDGREELPRRHAYLSRYECSTLQYPHSRRYIHPSSSNPTFVIHSPTHLPTHPLINTFPAHHPPTIFPFPILHIRSNLIFKHQLMYSNVDTTSISDGISAMDCLTLPRSCSLTGSIVGR